MALISVVVPVYNVEKYIRRCIDSILSQSFSDYDLILVDDGSPDGCGVICDEYEQKDSRIQVIHKINGGLADARNIGIDRAFEDSDSEWLTFIDSDDWIHPRYLEELYRIAVHSRKRIVVCNYKSEDSFCTSTVNSFDCNYDVIGCEDFFVDHNVLAVTAWGKLYSKECFEPLRYPVGKTHEDEFATYKALFANQTVAFTSAELYYYFNNEQSITRSSWNPKRMDAVEALEEQCVFFSKNNYDRARRTALHNLMWVMSSYIKTIGKRKEYESYKICLRKKLKEYLKRYKRELHLTFLKNGYYFEAAYPVEMKIYWTFYGILSRAKNLKQVF